MKIMLVCPEYPDTFWSYRRALRFIRKKAATPPLGLLTVAALLPKTWEMRVADLNVAPLRDKDLAWADYVFISAISVQKRSADEVIARCRERGVKVVAGGPLFTAGPEEYNHVDHLVLNEAEITLPLFLDDLGNGRPQHLYTTPAWADVTATPLPRWDLISLRNYSSMNVQYSRGCSFNCDFCDITLLYGRQSRTKGKDQILSELEALYRGGWRGGVFFVDDNFIMNKTKLKQEILPAIAGWMERNAYPFVFNTQASVNISDDDELMRLMARAGFDTVFVGIETPDDGGLAECSKGQNRRRDLVACVKKMQNFGLQVQGGFIVGFDSDPESIFERQIKFIQESGIVTAMVGLLNAVKGTKLHQRLGQEKRLLSDMSGDNTDYSINFIPKMNRETLMGGYRKILAGIYSPRPYYARVITFMKEYKPAGRAKFPLEAAHVHAFVRSVFQLGIVGKERFYYWKLMAWTLLRRPRLFPMAATFAIYGFHYRKTFRV